MSQSASMQNDRVIGFTLKVVGDKGNQQAVDQFAQGIAQKIQQTVGPAMAKAAQAATSGWGKSGLSLFGAGPGAKTPEQLAQEKAATANAKRLADAQRLGAMLAKQEEANARAMTGGGKMGGGRSTFQTVNEMREGFSMATHGAISLARGLALLGASSEKDLQKFTQLLAKIESFTSLGMGAVSIYTGLAKAAHNYAQATGAATAAVKANAAAEGLAATARMANFGKAGVTPRMLSAAGNAATPIASDLASAAIMRKLSQRTAGSAGVASAGSFALANAPAGLLAKLGGAMGTAGSWLGGMVLPAGLALAGFEGVQAARGKEGMLSSLSGLWGARSMAASTGKAAEWMAWQQANDLSERERQETVTAIRSHGSGQMFDHRLGGLRGGMRGGESTVNFSEGAALGSMRIALQLERDQAKSTAEREELTRRIMEVDSRRIDNAREAEQIAKREGEQKLRTARESLQRTREELQMRRETMRELSEKFMSAKEKFGDMSDADKGGVLAAGATVSRAREMLAKSKGMKTSGDYREAMRMLNSIDPETREKLKSLGLTGGDEAFRARSLDAADAARTSGGGRFDTLFGSDERERYGMESKVAARLSVDLKRDTNVIVNLERSTDELAKKLAGEVATLVKREESELGAKVKRETDAKLKTVNRSDAMRRGSGDGPR